ncbi:MAG: FAD binding domain-containing protein [Pigmentiphaga sp.]|uniref:FAD binding domain-containing protein n=1 Tax=Pigmentiphaga sp. TaxID=1977564 RepID=UPI0029AFB22F|nr:FAD binding domain-containing protein [Pigmentiphaga sp.]MDX3904703.1 FAD binding domain-containing protein [Pigmentiphaga sp.]
MKLAPIEYLRPRTETELLAALARHGTDAAILAGGQSLIPELALRSRAARVVIDINQLAGAGGIGHAPREGGDRLELRIGPLARHGEAATHELVRAHAPLLAMAAAHVGNAAVRNRGTVCGALAHADPAGEFPLAMVALDARFTLRSSQGQRILPAEDFFTGAFATARRSDEYLAEVRLPCAGPHDYHFFDEIARRPTAPAYASVALLARCRPGQVPEVRLAFSGVSDRPRLLGTTALGLARHPTDADGARAVMRAELARFVPDGDAAYRLHLAATLLERARAALCRHLDGMPQP